MFGPAEAPELPRQPPDIDTILETRLKLVERLRTLTYSQPLSLQDLSAIGASLGECLELKTRPVWERVLFQYLSQALERVLEDMAWRVAGNLSEFLRGRTVPVWSAGCAQHYAAAVITTSWPSRTFAKKPLSNYRLRIMSGPAAGAVGSVRWSRAQMGFVAERLGFGKPKGELYFEHPAELVGFHVLTLLNGQNGDATPNVAEVVAPSRYVTYNRDLVKLRRRIFDCPRDYQHDCVDCPLGMSDCVGATHRQPWYLAECATCRLERLFDSDMSTTICRACWFKENYS